MYQLGNFCEMCPRNTYQDEVGQSSCKKCPGELFTDGLMSRNISACKGTAVTNFVDTRVRHWCAILIWSCLHGLICFDWCFKVRVGAGS